VLALFAATLLMARLFSSWSDDENRFYSHWSRTDGLALILATLLLATVGLGGFLILRATRRRRWIEAYGFLFVGVIGTGLIQLLPVIRNRPFEMQVLWVAMAGFVAAAAAKRWNRVVDIAKSTSLTFSLVIPILFYQAFSWPGYDTEPTPLKFPRTSIAASRPVFILLFDEWSYVRATENGHFTDDLPNARKFAGQSLFFRAAQSEGDHTMRSVPKILFQDYLELVPRRGIVYADNKGRLAPSYTLPSLFTAARERGYNTAVLGVYLPYGAILGQTVDSCVSQPWSRDEDDLLPNALRFIASAARQWPDPIDQRWSVDHDMRVRLEAYRDILIDRHPEMLDLMRGCPNNTLAFMHSIGSHPPAVVDERGEFLGRRSGFDPKLYEGQMRFVDKQFGEMIDCLKASGKFENALIIVCSDHSLKTETDPAILSCPGWMYHVPLMIKWPGQKQGRTIDKPISLVQLQPFITAAMDGRSLDDALKIVTQSPLPTLHARTGIVEAPP